MFTGIIEEIGIVKQLVPGKVSYRLTVSANKVLEGTQVGDSIATNGICLTVTAIHGNNFDADVMAETVRRTNFSSLHAGSRVNLERALTPMSRLGGHIVSGHIEGQGTIAARRIDGIAMVVTIATEPKLLKYIIKKGSIAIDGISLTVTNVNDSGFSVSLIPHTAKETTLGFKDVGDSVNLETDIIGKYVEHMLSWNKKHGQQEQETPALDKATLLENGFM